MGTDNDHQLLAEAARGSEEAFSMLYRRHAPRVRRFALHLCGSAAVADEVVQEVFLALVRQLKQFDPARGSFLPYLLGIARHQALRLGRSERGFAELQDSMRAVEPDTGDYEELRRAIAQLPEAHREVVLLVELEELEYQQAAAVIGCPVGTVRSRLHRAKAMLMELLMPARERSSK